MNVSTLCLAILFDQDATGYEIRKLSTEGAYSYFVDASFGSIYPALNKLKQDGLVTMQIEHQEGKPARKTYSITQTGRRQFLESLFEPIKHDVIKSEFMLMARFANYLPKALVAKRLKDRQEHLKQTRTMIDDLREEFSDKPETVQWVFDYTSSCLNANMSYLKTHGDQLCNLSDIETAERDAAE